MSTVKVNVKWSNGRITLESVELNKDESPLLFKTKLLSLTGVPIDRQRLMFKGTVIKDESWPPNIQPENGSMFMLMGSSEKIPEAPTEKPKFVEDMTENELAVAMDVPAGLNNLGNTCYMSATIQCLKTIPELRETLRNFQGKVSLLATLSGEHCSSSVTAALKCLYSDMDASSVSEPMLMLRTLHVAIPRFSQRADGNVFQQQDANECWTELTRILQQNLKPLGDNAKYENFVDQYMGGSFEVELECDESPDEEKTKSEENFLQLSCFISQDVRYMQAGLISRMKETVTKFSPTLDRDASYTKTSRISRLPAYLTVQFVRFHYKGNVQTNAKLLRDVKFSMVLDVHELCTAELQRKLAPMRIKYKKADDDMASRKSKQSERPVDEPGSVHAPVDVASSSGGESVRSKAKTDFSSARARFLANDKEELERYTFKDDRGSNNSGFYELKAVLTHKGRSSSSGHYVAWIKKENQWFKCDDDLVEPVSQDDILRLSGGGDWHCAYVCLYGPRFLDLDERD